jgi:hypothetical protein
VKQQIALRIEADLLQKVRRCAADENRTMTNFIETVLKRQVEQASCTQQPGRPAEATALRRTMPRSAPERGSSKPD